ncbi:MAG: hypothetical protein MZV64_05310 [Ignavibacteriales bacterium]|nr:hypothetical protein [Ignavibacteriales bacterium]
MAMGANAAGIRNILCISGDSPVIGIKPVGSMEITGCRLNTDVMDTQEDEG